MHKLRLKKVRRLVCGQRVGSKHLWLLTSKTILPSKQGFKTTFLLTSNILILILKPKRIKLLLWSLTLDFNFIMARSVFYMIHNPCRSQNKAFNFSQCIVINFLLHSRQHSMYFYSQPRFKSDSILYTAFTYMNRQVGLTD